MPKSPLFSMVVPIYGVEKYINQCIDSVLVQSFGDFELILVEDGSNDSCPAICDKYAEIDKRIVVIHKKNGGLVSARKAGTAVAKGEYIICLDGDDWIEPTYLEEFAQIIYQCSPDVICCGYYEAYSNNKVAHHQNISLGLYDREKIEKTIFPNLIEDANGRYFSPQLWAKAYRRDLYTQVQMEVLDAISIGEDHACTKPVIFMANSVFILDKCLYNYRQNPCSMTKNKKAFSWDGPKMIGSHFEKFIDITQHDFKSQIYRNIVHNLFNVAVSQFNNQSSYKLTKNDILNRINDKYYQEAIQNVQYSAIKNKLAAATLKNRWIFLLFIYNKLN